MGTKASKLPQEADFHIDFEQAKLLFEMLTPKRMELVQELRKAGPMTIYALGKHLSRNYSNVHKDIKALRQLGLIELNKAMMVYVPWDSVNISFPLQSKK